MYGEDLPNIKTQLIIVALKFAEFPDHTSIDYDHMHAFWYPMKTCGEIASDLNHIFMQLIYILKLMNLNIR